MTGAPLIYATSQFQDHTEIGSDDCPPTPGDDDDDEDDKDKVSVTISSKNYRVLGLIASQITGFFIKNQIKHIKYHMFIL